MRHSHWLIPLVSLLFTRCECAILVGSSITCRMSLYLYFAGSTEQPQSHWRSKNCVVSLCTYLQATKVVDIPMDTIGGQLLFVTFILTFCYAYNKVCCCRNIWVIEKRHFLVFGILKGQFPHPPQDGAHMLPCAPLHGVYFDEFSSFLL